MTSRRKLPTEFLGKTGLNWRTYREHERSSAKPAEAGTPYQEGPPRYAGGYNIGRWIV